uniref:Uncharacterized protein n=1 Tax=Oryza punctata TaxID=4537 RepID=A0A0E0JEW3_ORYPU
MAHEAPSWHEEVAVVSDATATYPQWLASINPSLTQTSISETGTSLERDHAGRLWRRCQVGHSRQETHAYVAIGGDSAVRRCVLDELAERTISWSE